MTNSPHQKKSRRIKRSNNPRVKEAVNPSVTRQLVYRLKGKFKGKNLLKALTVEKLKEIEL